MLGLVGPTTTMGEELGEAWWQWSRAVSGWPGAVVAMVGKMDHGRLGGRGTKICLVHKQWGVLGVMMKVGNCAGSGGNRLGQEQTRKQS